MTLQNQIKEYIEEARLFAANKKKNLPRRWVRTCLPVNILLWLIFLLEQLYLVKVGRTSRIFFSLPSSLVQWFILPARAKS
jgi:hypothetical protein